MTVHNADTPAQIKADSSNQPDERLSEGGNAGAEVPATVDESIRDVTSQLRPADDKKLASANTENRFDDVVSGQFDADEESSDVVPAKRVLAPMAETPKLHKVLAQAGMGSRLEMEQLIMEGRITVNNEPAHIGQRIQFGDHVKVNGKPIRFRIDAPPARVIAYHKPVGEVVTHDDPQNRPTVFRRLPKLFQGKWQSVGRLDLNTEGLLLFTSSGELANNLMHPRFGLEREYAVRVLGALNKDEKQRLLEGVKLDDGVAQFGSIEEGGGEGSNCWYRVTISEGRNREVRRMFEAVGHAVSRLIRIRYGAMVLPRGLKRGAWMELDEGDIKSLMQVAGTRSSRAQGDEAGPGGPDVSRRDASGREPGARNQRRGGRGNGPRSSGSGQRNASAGGAKDIGQGRKSRAEPGDRQAGAAQPDPMKTAFGYIGADSFTRQRQDQGSGQGQRRGGGSGGGQRRGGRGR
ncbi:pseudouridine synthase [Rhodoferax ferrireducens]|uniref:pseudouridine synthase n=1 Tax=Rhodoferax ferrireducens TaxID=192843 RepID=UPI000E0D8C99|nr:pseudouridine synthase [Rhodoferax ferrireducens]